MHAVDFCHVWWRTYIMYNYFIRSQTWKPGPKWILCYSTCTTKKVAIRHVATVAVTVATWPDSHVSYWQRGGMQLEDVRTRVFITRFRTATWIYARRHVATWINTCGCSDKCIYYTCPHGRVDYFHAAMWPLVPMCVAIWNLDTCPYVRHVSICHVANCFFFLSKFKKKQI
jgi:hypothetical protein